MTRRIMEVHTPNPWLGQRFDAVWEDVVEAIKTARDCNDPESEYDLDSIIASAYEYGRDVNYVPKVTIYEFWRIVSNNRLETI